MNLVSSSRIDLLLVRSPRLAQGSAGGPCAGAGRCYPMASMPLAPLRLVLVLAAAAALGACRGEPLPPPDPKGKDLVEGAVVAAVTTAEKTPGIRTYKILHVDDYPDPVGYNLHLAAYDPKAATFEEAAAQRKRGGMTMVMKHLEV